MIARFEEFSCDAWCIVVQRQLMEWEKFIVFESALLNCFLWDVSCGDALGEEVQ